MPCLEKGLWAEYFATCFCFFHSRRANCPIFQRGVDLLNRWLYKEDLKRGTQQIPIMVTVNDPAQELYNGDVGVLHRDRQIACFGEREFPEYLLPPYDYAYLLSVHKSQGSEYDKVLILLPEGSEKFGREVLYTAITRAKKRVEILADSTTLEAILTKKTYRMSGI